MTIQGRALTSMVVSAPRCSRADITTPSASSRATNSSLSATGSISLNPVTDWPLSVSGARNSPSMYFPSKISTALTLWASSCWLNWV